MNLTEHVLEPILEPILWWWWQHTFFSAAIMSGENQAAELFRVCSHLARWRGGESNSVSLFDQSSGHFMSKIVHIHHYLDTTLEFDKSQIVIWWLTAHSHPHIWCLPNSSRNGNSWNTLRHLDSEVTFHSQNQIWNFAIKIGWKTRRIQSNFKYLRWCVSALQLFLWYCIRLTEIAPAVYLP